MPEPVQESGVEKSGPSHLRAPASSIIEAFRAVQAADRFTRMIVTVRESEFFTVIHLDRDYPQMAETFDLNQRGMDILCRNLAMGGA